MGSKLLRISSVAVFSLFLGRSQAQTPAKAPLAPEAVIRQYCLGCHNAQIKTAGVVIDPASLASPAPQAELWERVIKQLRAKSMPPVGMPRPDAATYERVSFYIEGQLDKVAAAKPNPGEQPNLHRLTRTEYSNAIRDLLGLDNLPKEMDFTLLLPADNSASGFDNISDLLYVSPATMERYLDAATKISRLAVGDPNMPVMVNIHQLPLEGPQDENVEGLPLGTRGGIAIKSYFPLDAEYEFTIELAGAARDQHQFEINVDGESKQLVTIGGAGAGGRGGRGGRGGAPNQFRIPIKAGPRLVGVTFLQKTEALDEATLQPRQRTRGTQPSIAAVTIRGPYKVTSSGETPSRERIFTCHPQSAAEEGACAKQILSELMRHAYRRSINDADVARLMPFYENGRKERDFDLGIQTAIERLLVSPQFLYRVERDPADAVAGKAFRISDLEFASRLSFFIWSSLPDDELINLANSGKLKDPKVLEQQVHRMMADPRSEALVNNFATQWLYLRDVDVKRPDLFVFHDFEENLRNSFEEETQLFLNSVLRQDKSVLDLLTANYTFVNERLAKHYGIPDIRGSEFRKVIFPKDSPRGGLLGQGGILTLTSYSTRTSPVQRGKYVLENLLASPPPPPPPTVPSLSTEGSRSDEILTLRQAMERHRKDPACANCHARMDPLGFALENFDAVGKWRDTDDGKPIEVSSKLADGTVVNGLQGVKNLLLKDPERFVGALTEKLMMYAVSRNVQYFDRPSIRQIVHEAAPGNYKFEALVLGVAKSAPFQMRMAKPEKQAVAAVAEKN